MICSNWQGAIWRGAVLVLMLWSGLAWTQTPGRPAADPAERIMVVHENGKSTRCRVLESWQMPDRRVAHLLEAIDSGERITIVDEQAPNADNLLPTRPMPKRIFTWGQGRKTPPEGSPVPPHLKHDSGIVITNETPSPLGIPVSGPVIVNKAVDTKSLGSPIGTRNEGQLTVVEPTPAVKGPSAVNKTPATPSVVPAQPFTIEPLINPETPLTIPAPPKSLPVATPNLPAGPGVPPVNPTSVPGVVQPVNPPIGPVSVAPLNSIITSCDPATPGNCQPVESHVKKPWRPGANIQAWLQGKPKAETVRTDVVKKDDGKKFPTDELFAQQNKVAEKQLQERVERVAKTPFSTAMLNPLPTAPQPEAPNPLGMPKPSVPENTKPSDVKRDMWATGTAPMLPPGKSLVDPAIAKLPSPPQGKIDPLTAPERLNPHDDRLKPKAMVLAPISKDYLPPPNSIPVPQGWPIGTQSVAASKAGLVGPLTYVPVPTVTVPVPHSPPSPPPPTLPEAPSLNAHVNAFSPAPAPKAAPQPPPWQQNGAFPNPNPMAQQQILAQQQQMLAQQQQMLAQQAMMQGYYRQNPYQNPYQAPYMPVQAYNPMPAQGPVNNFSRQYGGPLAPNPFAVNPSVQTGFAPMPYPTPMPQYVQQAPPMHTPMPQYVQQAPPQHAVMPQYPAPAMQPVQHQQVPTQQQAVTQQVDQLVKVLRESPYPAQREWAAQSLASFEWRAHPQIVPALVSSASQDPAASVRAGCVFCLGRMGAAVEPVVGVLHALRNDIDPRVRQEAEQAFTRLGQTPMLPQ